MLPRTEHTRVVAPLLGIAALSTASVTARLVTGSLGPSVTMHATYNFLIALRLVLVAP
jgi:hypothetical protein